MVKTTLTKCLSKANSLSGLTVMGRDTDPKELSQSDMESPFIGGTSKKMSELFIDSWEEAMCGDEIQSLASKSGMVGHEKQAIQGLVALTSEYEGLSHFYGIGYQDQVEEGFLKADEGLDRRFPKKLRIIIERYTVKELSHILIRYLINQGKFDVGDCCAATIYSAVMTLHESHPHFFKLQAAAMVEIGGHIVDTIKGAKTLMWVKGNDTDNAQLLLWCFNNYMREYNGVELTSVSLIR